MPAPRILVVEDDSKLAEMAAHYLREHGFIADTENRGDRAIQRILDEQPSLVVLDVMLPGKDGLAVCREVRSGYSGLILMLTARGDEADEVLGLELGADDYLAKPFRPRILLARIRALMRRPSPASAPQRQQLVVGDLALTADSREARVRGAKLPLTSGEFDLLWKLASKAGQAVSREFLHEQLVGTDYSDLERSIDLRVSRLRHKLEKACPGLDPIKTIRGVGYLYARS
jgi:two-component system response regulator RstA